MRPIEFEILLALAPGDRHGYAIIQDIEARRSGADTVETGTLYRALQRLVDDGLIRSVEPPGDVDADERRRYYRITSSGRGAAVAEARRMAGLLERARAAKLLSGGV